jgi:hypothetical protein
MRAFHSDLRSPIEHANFVSQETVAMMGEHRVYFDPTFISARPAHRGAGDTHLPDHRQQPQAGRCARPGRCAWAKQHDVPIVFGTDAGPEAQKSQLREFEMRVGLGSTARVIRSATATNAELLMQEGRSSASLLPTPTRTTGGGRRPSLIRGSDRPAAKQVIMKDGVLYKNERRGG